MSATDVDLQMLCDATRDEGAYQRLITRLRYQQTFEEVKIHIGPCGGLPLPPKAKELHRRISNELGRGGGAAIAVLHVLEWGYFESDIRFIEE